MSGNKPKVFAIIPFDDDFLKLYEELKGIFENDFEFVNGGDLDNQRNILQDIVEGIHRADIIIADVTGLNANVFYELGMAHAMDKKVIIITQDIEEVPFDIRSYRVTEYGLKFFELPTLVDELKKLLNGAVHGTIKYGNPVFDYLPDINICRTRGDSANKTVDDTDDGNPKTELDTNNEVSDDNGVEDGGFLDLIADIQDNTVKTTEEIKAISEEMQEMNSSVTYSTNEINRVKSQSGKADVSFLRNICRKLADPIDAFSGKLNNHIINISNCWDTVENSYLILLDNQYARKPENKNGIQESMTALSNLQESMYSSDQNIRGLISILYGNLGVERRLNKAVTTLISELESYMTMTQTMESSIDRIITKGNIVLNSVEVG